MLCLDKRQVGSTFDKGYKQGSSSTTSRADNEDLIGQLRVFVAPNTILLQGSIEKAKAALEDDIHRQLEEKYTCDTRTNVCFLTK